MDSFANLTSYLKCIENVNKVFEMKVVTADKVRLLGGLQGVIFYFFRFLWRVCFELSSMDILNSLKDVSSTELVIC